MIKSRKQPFVTATPPFFYFVPRMVTDIKREISLQNSILNMSDPN